MAKETQNTEQEKKEFKEITLKFGKGLVGEPFQGKDGKEYKQIAIPNQDPNDKSPWASFVVRANAVHEDQFGKGMWIKLPSEGSTTVRKDQLVGQDDAGKNVYETTKTKVPNKELKSMVEFYKNNDRNKDIPKDALEDKPKASLKDKVEKNKEKVAENKKTKAAEKTQEKAPKAKAKSKGQEL